MKKDYQLNQLGEALIDYINKFTDFSIKQVAEECLGLHKISLYRRLHKNNIKLEEAQKIADFIGCEVSVTLGELTASNVHKEQEDFRKALEREKEITELQRKVIALQEQVNELSNTQSSK